MVTETRDPVCGVGDTSMGARQKPRPHLFLLDDKRAVRRSVRCSLDIQ